MQRRDFLRLSTGAALAACLPALWTASAKASEILPHTDLPYSGNLHVFNLNTRETLRINYLTADGRLDLDALDQLDHLFRCKVTHKTVRIDPRLYLLLDAVHTRLGASDTPYTLVSGYRSPEYNTLRSTINKRVSKSSYHVKGMAADMSIEGVALTDIRDLARNYQVGGVGKYSKFVHMDTGPVRTW